MSSNVPPDDYGLLARFKELTSTTFKVYDLKYPNIEAAELIDKFDPRPSNHGRRRLYIPQRTMDYMS